MCAYDGAVTWEIVEEGEYVDVWLVGRFFFAFYIGIRRLL